MVIKTNSHGVTLVEMLIATSVFSLVIMGATSLYVAGVRHFESTYTSSDRTRGYIVLEKIAREASRANRVVATTTQLKLRWDYDQTGTDPNPAGAVNTGTAANTDDTWVKYGLISDRLYRRTDAASGAPNSDSSTNVTTADPQVDSGLVVLTGSSSFAAIGNNSVRIILTFRTGNPSRDITLQKDVLLHGATN